MQTSCYFSGCLNNLRNKMFTFMLTIMWTILVFKNSLILCACWSGFFSPSWQYPSCCCPEWFRRARSLHVEDGMLVKVLSQSLKSHACVCVGWGVVESTRTYTPTVSRWWQWPRAPQERSQVVWYGPH